jgi:hypothetical protein
LQSVLIHMASNFNRNLAHPHVSRGTVDVVADGCAAVQVCVRAAPLEPGSPVAKELRGAGSPFALDWQQQQQQSGDGAGAAAGGSLASDGGADAAATAADIINLEQRKVGGGHANFTNFERASPSCSVLH